MPPEPNQEGGREREPQPQEMLSEILKLHEKARVERAEDGEKWLESRVAGLPESVKAEVRKNDKERVEDGLATDKRGKWVDKDAVRFEETYTDKRFKLEGGQQILKESFSKERVIDWVKGLLDEKPTAKDLEKIARLSFDANGLKAVNDLSGSHDKGTEYLRRIAEVFAAEDGPARQRLTELGVTEVLPVTGGGDEYSVIVRADRQLKQEDLAEVVALYSQEISEIDASDLVDFNDEATLLRFLGIPEAEKGKPETAAKITDLKKEIPEGFAMRASAAGGASTLLEGMRNALLDKRDGKRLTGDDKYDAAVAKMMGGLWDASDKVALENKMTFKEKLKSPESSPENKFFSKVLARTTEARVLEATIEHLQLEGKKAELFVEDIKNFLVLAKQDGSDPAAVLKALEEKLAAGL